MHQHDTDSSYPKRLVPASFLTFCAAVVLAGASAQQTKPAPYTEAEKSFATEIVAQPLETALKTIAAVDASRITEGLYTAIHDIGNQVFVEDPHGSVIIFQEDEAIAARAGLPLLAADAHGLQAAGLFGDGEAYEATLLYDQTLAMYQAAGASLKRIASVHSNRGNVRNNLGDTEGALEDANEALRENRELGDEVGIARAESGLGSTLSAHGDFAAAQAAFDDALRIARAHGEKTGESFVLNNMSMMYAVEGDYALAVRDAEQSLQIKRAAGNKANIATSLINLANFYHALDRDQDANRALVEAAQLGRDTHRRNLTANAIAEMGIIELDNHHPDAALKLLEEGNAADPDDVSNNVVILYKMAEAYNALGNYQHALKFSADSAALAHRAGSVDGVASATLTEAHADISLGRLNDARAALKESIGAVEQMRGNIAGGAAERQLFLAQRTDSYRLLAAIDAQQGDWSSALESSEGGKGRILLDVYAGDPASATASLTDAERKEETRLRGRVHSLDMQHSRIGDSPADVAKRSVIDQDLKNARIDLANFRSHIYAQHPELRLRRADFAATSLSDLQALLPDRNTALMEYELTPRGTYMFVVTRATRGNTVVHGYKLAVSTRELTRHVHHYREQLASRDPEFVTESRWLYASLLQPAQLALKGKTSLIVVPDGVLWHVPFQSLQLTSGTYVAESTAITYIPSLAVLHALKTSPAQHRETRTLLAMGDPGGETPDQATETQALQTLYGPKNSKGFLGRSATLGQFRLSSASYDVVHIAAHGVFNDNDPMSSHMVLASTTGRPRDGWLQARELQDMKLRAEVVVLSGCETGQGSFEDGEGLVGMSWAVLAAGAHGTVASAWRVEALSTTELMLSFHTDMLHGISKSEALRRAELKLIHSDKYRHPFYWAAFDLMGDGA